MILLLLLLIPNIVYADAIDFINGYSFANTINNNCDDCDDCRKTNKILRQHIIKLETERNEWLTNQTKSSKN